MEPKEQIFARMYVVITLVSLLPILVAFQVLNISVLEGPELREKVVVQSTAYLDTPASRGIILDAKERAMAVNVEQYDILIDSKEDGYAAGSEEFFAHLSRLTNQSVGSFKRKISRSRSPRYVSLVRDVTLSKKDITLLEEESFVIVERKTRRKYTYGQTAAHVVGFMGTDGGLTGLEKEFNDILEGSPGRKTAKKNSRGQLRPIPGGPVVDPVHGTSLVLTIDLIQQAILEEELKKGVIEAMAEWGTAIALNVNTGAIVAMANYPTFDLNEGVFAKAYQLRNHAISDIIEPGSTMKVLPAVAAIESGTVTMDQIIDTGDGPIRLHGFTLSDTHPHGKISFSEVIKVSSNIGTALVAEMGDKGEFYKYARNFGFNQPTYIELPGEALSTKVRKTDSWSRSTHSAMSRGYGIEGTPLQITLAYAALANGGLLMRPYIVAEKRDAEGRTIWKARPDSVRRAFKKTTADIVTPAFESVLQKGGTATEAAIPGLRIAGKTGTAKTARGGGYASRDYRATFVGFYPVEKPEIVLLVLMDAPRKSIFGGIVAAPVFRRTTERWLASMPEVAEYVQMDSLRSTEEWAGVPALGGKPVAVANRSLLALGMKAEKSASYEMRVIEQNISPGTVAGPGTPVRLASVRDSTVTMPDVVGLSLRDAVLWLAKLGVKSEVQGHGMVQAQWPEPGSDLPQTARISSK
jgi:cell division protein FtsI (penicillin-binding protein 3)